MDDPVITVLNLLDNNWENSNTSIDYDPRIHSGWIDLEGTKPQVTITSPDETPTATGSTPFTGFDPGTGNPVQEIRGGLQIDCWSSREWESTNPKKLTFEFSEEVKRILDANITDATDLRYTGYEGRRQMVETEVQPTTFRYVVTAYYLYQNRA